MHNRGLLLARLGRLQEAEESHRGYVAALPDSPRAHGDLADVLLALGRNAEALGSLEHALSLSPSDISVRIRHGIALACLRRFDEAQKSIAGAFAQAPRAARAFVDRIAPGGDPEAVLAPRNIYLARGYTALGQCDWSGWAAYVEEMRAAAQGDAPLEPAAGFMAQHTPLDGRGCLAIGRAIARRIEARMPALAPAPPRKGGRIRVGLLSPDFREHLMARVLLPLFELADRSRFELYAYSLARDDGSAPRRRIRAAAHAFRDLHALSDRHAAEAIRRDAIDVLLDVAGYTAGGRFAIVAQRPARVQAQYLGFSSTLGSSRVDYVIVDRVVAPSADEWSEKRVFLPSTFALYDYRDAPPDAAPRREEYALPGDAFVFCAFHRAQKIEPGIFGAWMRILARTPRSVLWLLEQPPGAVRNLRASAKACGIDPARLVFAPFEPASGARYPARQRLGDLFLDTQYHGAITTAGDALGVGLPLLTLRGHSMASRAGESLLRAAGLPDLVAADLHDYEERAVRLASDISKPKKVLLENRKSAPLFDTAGRVRELEAAFESMLR